MLFKRMETAMPTSTFTAILEKEGPLYVALCPELDVASQGATVEEATANLKEAVELFLECADPRAEYRERPSRDAPTGLERHPLTVSAPYP
jgi:predicted RNase H-like HicB family nuclease